MFGQHSEIEGLKKLVTEFEESNIHLEKQVADQKLAHEKLNDAYLAQVKTTAEANQKLFQTKAALADVEVKHAYYKDLADEFKDMNEVLDGENRDLAYKLELLQNLLKQMHVNVKLPVRKTDK